MAGFVEGRAVTQGHGAGFPAASVATAVNLADRVEELVARILLPVDWLPPAGNDDAASQPGATGGEWNGGG
jgi:hypothetical protein